MAVHTHFHVHQLTFCLHTNAKINGWTPMHFKPLSVQKTPLNNVTLNTE